MNRRHFLSATLAATATAASAPHLFAQAGKPPAQAPEGQLRITDILTYNTGRLYVRITTDNRDIEGFGEINYGDSDIASTIINTYKPLLLNTDPTRIEYLWQLMYRAHRNLRNGSTLIAAFAGIDMALWDILGKVANLPVHTLLGGPVRDRILFYPSPKAYKCTSHVIHDMIQTPATVDSIANDMEKTRERLGKDGYLMYDGHGKLTPQAAIQLCKRIEHLMPLYMEEVVPPEHNADLVKVKRATTVPLAVGERMATIHEFRPVLEAQAADVLNADIVTIGGISQLHKLAHIAELYALPLAPHGTHSLLGLAASLHVDAAHHNFLIQEAYPNHTPFLSADWMPKDDKGNPWPKDSHMPIPKGPGLGVKVDINALEEAAAKHAEKPDKGINKAYFRNDGTPGDR